MITRIPITLVLVSALNAVVAFSAEVADWKLRTQTYATGAVAHVTKNIACLEVYLSTSCQKTPSAAKAELQKLINNVSKVAQGVQPGIAADSKETEMDISPQNRFVISAREDNPLQNVVVDTCEKFDMPKGGLSEKVYSASTMIKFQIADKASIISAIRREVSKYAEFVAKSNKPLSVSANVEKYTVDPSILEASKKQLDDDSRLSKQKSRMVLDEKVYGEFTERYVVSVQETGSPAFLRIRPTLDGEGNSVLEAHYTFRIDYAPKNTGTGATTKAPAVGQFTKIVKGKTVVTTDFYKSAVNVTTTCHASAEEARAALGSVFEAIKNKAEQVVKSGPASYQNRVIIRSASNPALDRSNFQPWSYAFKPNKQDRYVTSYLNLCDGKEFKETDMNKLPENYRFSQSFAINASSYAGLLELQAFVASMNEKAGPAENAAISDMAALSPQLDEMKHQAAVEVTAYANALGKLLAGNGELANTLIDELNASEAYYQFQGYTNSENLYGGASPQSAAMAPGDGRMASMKAANEAADVEVSEDNIPLERVASYKVTTVQYRAKRDLIEALKQARAPRNILDPHPSLR